MTNACRRGLAALLLLLCARTAFADGLIIIENSEHRVPGHFPFAPLEVTYHHVDVAIDGPVAVTSVDQEFRNPSAARTEGTYLFPLPAGAHIDKFSMDINGQQAEAELLSAEKARAIYEEIVRKTRDPALLEYSGRGAFKVRIFPIEPHGTKHIKISYTQVLKEDAGLVEYSYPLNTEKFSSKLIGDVSVNVTVKSPDALKSIYCPSHNATIKRESAERAMVSYQEKNARPDTDFKLMFSREKKPVGIKLLSYQKPGSDEGYFMLMASPGFGAIQRDDKAAAKDIAFVVDTSGSMADRGKLEQAKKALNFCLANLNRDDRFDIVRFSTEAQPLFGALKSADAANVEKARSFVDELRPTGGTAIDAALSAALRLRDSADSARPFLMIFLTDGLPTVGVTGEDEIVRNATARAGDVRIFCFGVGYDVNTHLLDRLADATRAASQYVLPDENIEMKVSSFYEKIREPVMTGVKLAIAGDGISTSQLYPSALPDIFKGETLLVFGRFRGAGPAAATLSGTIALEKKDFVEDVRFTGGDSNQSFIATMWATRRVGWLLDEIRMHGESAELKDEVVNLAREHGIVTPYTAYLIIEDESKRNVPVAQRTLREMEQDRVALERARGAYDSTVTESAAPAARSGAQAVTNAQAYDKLKRGENAQQAQQHAAMGKTAATPAASAPGYRYAQNYAQQVKLVNGRAFYQNGAVWSDSALYRAPQEIKRQNIRFNSDEYFALLRDKPTAAQWLALGNNVDVILDETLYSVRDQ